MASQRPGFARTNTGHAHEFPTSSKTYELGELDSKDGGFTEVRPVESDDVPDYESLRDGAQITDKVETAADIITKVIHVEDDKNMRVLTFRVFFVGMQPCPPA